jgi:biopolymer transport protein ExbB/TolQ
MSVFVVSISILVIFTAFILAFSSFTRAFLSFIIGLAWTRFVTSTRLYSFWIQFKTDSHVLTKLKKQKIRKWKEEARAEKQKRGEEKQRQNEEKRVKAEDEKRRKERGQVVIRTRAEEVV